MKIADFLKDVDPAQVIGNHVPLKRSGGTLKGICPFHGEKSPSFVVYGNESAKPGFHCYGCGAHGDVLDFIQQFHSCGVSEGLEILGFDASSSGNPAGSPARRTIPSAPRPAPSGPLVSPVMPVPPSAPRLTDRMGSIVCPIVNPNVDLADPLHSRVPGRTGTTLYPYRDRHGALLHYILRIENRRDDGTTSKITLPVTWTTSSEAYVRAGGGAGQWAFVAPGAPRPLYHLDKANLSLADHGASYLVIVEGEKTANAAHTLFEGRAAVISWSGGSGYSAVMAADLHPLLEMLRDHPVPVVLVPDLDDPGYKAMRFMASRLASIGIRPVRLLDPVLIRSTLSITGEAKGWDLADLPADTREADSATLIGLMDALRDPAPLAMAADYPEGATPIPVPLPGSDSRRNPGIIEIPLMTDPHWPVDYDWAGLLVRAQIDKSLTDEDWASLARLSHTPVWTIMSGALLSLPWVSADLAACDDRLSALNGVAIGRAPTVSRLSPLDNGGRVHMPSGAVDHQNVRNLLDAMGINLRCLGFRGKFYIFLSGVRGDIIALKAEDMRSENVLYQLAPPDFWIRAFPIVDPKSKSQAVFEHRHAVWYLMNECHIVGGYDSDHVRGRGVWRDSDQNGDPVIVYHAGDRLIAEDGRVLPLTAMSGCYVYTRKAVKALPAMDDPLRDDEGMLLITALRMVAWESSLSADLVAGWIAISFLSGITPWRPHLWMTGGAGSGKTWLMEKLIRPALGNSVNFFQSATTEAGIRQTQGEDCTPIMQDEAESEDVRAQARMHGIMELARQASAESNGTLAKGSGDGQATHYTIRAPFLFSSIVVPIRQRADSDRITVCRLLKQAGGEARQRFSVLRSLVSEMMTPKPGVATFSDRLMARQIRNASVVVACIDVFVRVCASEFSDQRTGDQYGPMLAGAWSLTHSHVPDDEEARQWVTSREWSGHIGSIERDEIRLLSYIMGSDIRVDYVSSAADTEQTPRPASYMTTIGEVVRTLHENTDLPEQDRVNFIRILARSGIAYRAEFDGFGPHVFISNTANALSAILSKTPWPANWGNVLSNIKGARATGPQRMMGAATTSRCVAIPYSSIP